MTVALDILNYIKTRLETILISSGFNTDLGKSVSLGRKYYSVDTCSLPMCSLFDLEDEPEEADSYLEKMMITLDLMVECYIKNENGAQNAIDDVISDVKTAVLDVTDRKLGGLTLDFGYAGREIVWPEDASDVIPVRLRFRTLYRENYGSP
jgi:hypothetical protein